MFKKFREISNRIAQQEWQQAIHPKDIPAPVAGDQPPLSGLINRVTLSGIVLIEQGVIQDVFPFLRLYKVAISGGPIIVCTYAADSTSGNFGVQDHTTLTIGTTVWVVRTPGASYGAIFAVQPEFLTVAGMRHADEIVSGSNIGYISDPFYRTILLRKPPKGGMPYWDGSHLDSIPGEWVKMAHTGVAIFADPFLAGIRANEYCGVWVNYFDSLLRIAGLNYQKWTGGSEENEYIDWDKYISYKGYAYTLAGQAGMKTASGHQFQELSAAYHEHPELRISAIEPKSAIFGESNTISRFPVHNKQEWGGIIGQGGLEFVTSNYAPFGQSPVPVSRIQIANTASGFHIVQADRGILLAKYPLIPTVVRAADFDEELYDADGKCVQRATYLIPKLLKGETIFNAAFYLAASRNLHDIRNYLCNWEALAGIYAYINKFKILTEKEIGKIKRVRVHPNDRFGGGCAYIYLDPAGDIVLENRSGARIELIGKDIRITAPGKIIIDSGKKIATFSRMTELFSIDRISISSKARSIALTDKLELYADFIYGYVAQMDRCVTDPYSIEILGNSAQEPKDIPTQPWIYGDHNCVQTKYKANPAGYRGPKTFKRTERYCVSPPDLPGINLENSEQLFAGIDVQQTEQQLGEDERWSVARDNDYLYILLEQ